MINVFQSESPKINFCIGKYMHFMVPFWLLVLYLVRVKRIWYVSPMRAAKVQASLRICAVLPDPPLLTHTSSESRGTFRQKARSQAPLNGWACAVTICHEDTNSLDGAHLTLMNLRNAGTQATSRQTFYHHEIWSKVVFKILRQNFDF